MTECKWGSSIAVPFGNYRVPANIIRGTRWVSFRFLVEAPSHRALAPIPCESGLVTDSELLPVLHPSSLEVLPAAVAQTDPLVAASSSASYPEALASYAYLKDSKQRSSLHVLLLQYRHYSKTVKAQSDMVFGLVMHIRLHIGRHFTRNSNHQERNETINPFRFYAHHGFFSQKNEIRNDSTFWWPRSDSSCLI